MKDVSQIFDQHKPRSLTHENEVGGFGPFGNCLLGPVKLWRLDLFVGWTVGCGRKKEDEGEKREQKARERYMDRPERKTGRVIR